MRRFFIDKQAIKDKSVIITGKEVHHIVDVIRLKVGDRFLGFDGMGKIYTLCIKRLSDEEVEAVIEKASSAKPDASKIMLACAIPKARKIEYIIEKATELGVSDIVPMITERTIVKISDEDRKLKRKRWENIALEASKQCGRNNLPKIHDVVDLKKAIELTDRLGYKKKILPCLSEGTKELKEVKFAGIKEAAIFIGPEGDFTDKEIDFARKAGFEMVSLGPLVLKVDTACIFTISIIRESCEG
ncbi:MAG: RsmE family RNA methyltransferase [Candidatus Omnitrophota bacterium]